MKKLLQPIDGQMALFDGPLQTPGLFDEWSSGTVMLTPNRRLARTLAQQYDLKQLQDGHQTWEKPAIFGWEEWLDSMWRRHGQWLSTRSPVSADLEALLWEELVSEAGLVDEKAAARMAASAHALCLEYGLALPKDPSDQHWSEEQRAFCRWQHAYVQRLEELDLLDRHAIGGLLQQFLLQRQMPAPAEVRWVAFERLTPVQRSWRETLNVLGCRQHHHAEPPQRRARAGRLATPDSRTELRQAISWLADKVRRRSQQKVALVVPDLASQRSEIESLLEQTLPNSRLWNLSLGKPLAQWPLVRAGLCALQLLRPRVAFEDVSAVLRSPYLGASVPERCERALWETALRKRHAATGSLQAFLLEAPPELATDFQARLQQVSARLEQAPPTDTPAAWTQLFQEVLRTLYWPGARPLNSAEHQTAQRALETLGRLLSLQVAAPAMSLEAALDRVQRLLEETVFQPESNNAAPFQVLGLLEAAGLQFDALWVTGLSDDAWPALGRANPFLPLELQRRASMPHSSPEADLDFATRVTHRLLQGAPVSVFSYALKQDDRPLRPSRLITSLPELEGAPARVAPSPTRTLFQQRPQLELWQDEQAPPLGDQERARGGSAIFKWQATCGFRAFAQLRLGAEPLEPVAPGLLPAERGTLAHRVLELAWEELEDSAALRRADLPELCHRAAARAVAEFRGRRPDALTGRLAELEVRRLATLAERWLELEKQRELPFRVLAREKRQSLELFGLRFNTVVDRIDLVNEQMILLLDYKTGDTHTDSWYGERPDEPQLPLYVVGSEQPVHGLAFAALKPPYFRFSGNCADPRAFPKAMPADDPEVLRSEWSRVLADLAEQFKSGRADVDPKHPGRTCQFCSLKTLCRVGQREETLP